MKTPFKAFVTKYALSSGIKTVEATRAISDPRYISYGTNGFVGPTDWHNNEEDAKAKAESMRKKKIKSLESQLKKLRDLKF